MRGLKKRVHDDVLEVMHHEVPDTAEGAGAPPIPAQASADTGITWRRMLRGVTAAHAVGGALLLIAVALYGGDTFYPMAMSSILLAGAAVWLGRGTKASVVYSLVVLSLALLFFGSFGWTGFLHPQSWLEMSFALLGTVIPIAGIVAAIATLRHHDGADAARTSSLVTASITAVVLVVGIVGSATVSDATRLPGDVALRASNTKFTPASITAKAGNVAIYFQNKDPFVHNLRIEGHGTSKDAAGRSSIRYVFRDMTPGTYTLFCNIHTDMKVALRVT